MTDTDVGAQAPDTAQAAEGPGIRVLAQFIRDLSFENPRAPESLRGGAAQPQIDLGVEMNARGRDDGYYEVDLKLSAKASRDDGAIFVVELMYGGVFQIAGVSAEDMEPVLLIECPRYLFPFARRIIADTIIDGGFPPFLLEPIDFAAVYAARQNQGQSLIQPAPGQQFDA